MPVIQNLLRVPQVAKLLQISERKVYRMIARGHTPPVVKLGRHVRFVAFQVDGWIRLGCPTDGSYLKIPDFYEKDERK